MSDTPTTTVEIEPTLCEYAGIYCGALTVEQLQAAGKARICCRHLLYTDEDE